MLKKSIKKEDLGKINEEILQVLEGKEIFDRPGLFEKVWPERRFSVTDALLEFFEIGVVGFKKEVEISRLRVLKVVERIFDNYKEFGDLPFKANKYLTDKKFVQAHLEIYCIFAKAKHIKIVDDDLVGDVEPGQEPGVSY